MSATAFRYHTEPPNRLVPYLLLAFTIHAIALYLLKVPAPPAPLQPSPVLEIHLTPPPHTHPQLVVDRQAAIRAIEKAALPQPSASTPAITMETKLITSLPVSITSKNTEETIPTAELPPHPSAKPSRLSVQSLLDAARGISKEESQYQPQPKSDSPALADRPVLPQLAAALSDKKKPPPGITQYADGMIKVVTPYGTVYCSQATPNLAKTGPLDPENIPMTCP